MPATPVEFIYAEGLAIGAEHKVKALDAATANIARLSAKVSSG